MCYIALWNGADYLLFNFPLILTFPQRGKEFPLISGEGSGEVYLAIINSSVQDLAERFDLNPYPSFDPIL